MNWEPVSFEELKELGRRIDSEFVYADSLEELYVRLNKYYPHEQWTPIRAPVWCGDKLIILMVKPRTE